MQIEIGKNCYIAPTAVLIGNVKLSDDVIILDHAVIRGDLSQIVIGEGTNVQDNAVIHADPSFPVQVGSGVSIGHGSIVHGSTIEDDVIIGMELPSSTDHMLVREVSSVLAHWCLRISKSPVCRLLPAFPELSKDRMT